MGSELSGWARVLFAERGTARRVLLAGAVFAAFLAYVELRWDRPWVGLEDGLRNPQRHAGSLVLHGPARVLEADPQGFLVRTARGMKVRVETGEELVHVGDEVVYWGTILPTGHLALLRRDGRTFLRLSPRGIQKRVAMYAVSLGVLAYVALRFHRNFAFRERRLWVRGRLG